MGTTTQGRWWVAIGLLAAALTTGLAWSQLRWIDALHRGEQTWRQALVEEATSRTAAELSRLAADAYSARFEAVAQAGSDALPAQLLKAAADADRAWLATPLILDAHGVRRLESGSLREVNDPRWRAWTAAWSAAADDGESLRTPADPPAIVIPVPGSAELRCVLWPIETAALSALARDRWEQLATARLRDLLDLQIWVEGRPLDPAEAGSPEARAALPLQPSLELVSSGPNGEGTSVRMESSGREEVMVGIHTRTDTGPMVSGRHLRIESSHRWELVAVPRGASLASMARRERTRNLIQASATIVLLIGSWVMLGLLIRRERRLATDQVAFLAGITHEIRTPLAVLSAAADNLADGIVTDPEQARRYGDTVRRETARLRALAEPALLLAGSPVGMGTFESLDPRSWLEEAIERLARETGRTPESVRLHVDADAPAVRGDRTALLGAVGNLLHNAVRHGPDGGVVSVAARRVGTDLDVTVHDTGHSLTRRDIRRIFRPFERAADTRRAQVPGSGLGLAIVERVVRAHGGRVRVDLAPTGTTFGILLPGESAP